MGFVFEQFPELIPVFDVLERGGFYISLKIPHIFNQQKIVIQDRGVTRFTEKGVRLYKEFKYGLEQGTTG